MIGTDLRVMKMRKGLWPLMEVLGHHARKRVWDGDQISKTDRDALVYGGYLKHCGDGYTEITHSGRFAWQRLKTAWQIAQWFRLQKWRIRESIENFADL